MSPRRRIRSPSGPPLKRQHHVGGALLLALCLLVMATPASAIPHPITVRSRKLAAGFGLRIMKIHGHRIVVLTFSSSVGSIRSIPARQSFPMRAHPSTLAARAGAFATLGGDFSAPGGMPDHMLVRHREVWTTGIQHGWSLSTAGEHVYMGRTRYYFAVRPSSPDALWAPFRVREWNAGPPRRGGVVAFSRRGGDTETPLGGHVWCAVRLDPSTQVGWSRDKTRTVRGYVVARDRCSSKRMRFGPFRDSVVLDAHPHTGGAGALEALSLGESVQVSWNFGHPGVTDVTGAMPQLVKAGANVAPDHGNGAVRYDASIRASGPDGDFFGRNPRSVLGASEGCEEGLPTCRLFMVAVDGRQPKWSKGVRLPWMAHFMIQLGAWNAINLDGGGSTMMWLRNRGPYCQDTRKVGCLVTRPCYGERPNVTAIAAFASP